MNAAIRIPVGLFLVIVGGLLVRNASRISRAREQERQEGYRVFSFTPYTVSSRSIAIAGSGVVVVAMGIGLLIGP